MHISLTSHLRTGRRLLAAIALTAATTLALCQTPALASSGSQYGSIGQYGEVTRFGEFDTQWFNEGVDSGKLSGSSGTDSQPTPGKFLDPTGFAVDTNDEGTGATAVYVLDRVSGFAWEVGSQGTEWRLQKLNDTGAVLGTTEFYLPANEIASARDVEVFVGVVGLAVDDSTGRIYTVLYESTGTGNETTRQATEVLDWSTKPNGSAHLVAPTGSTLDSVSTPESGYSNPGLASTASQLGATPLFEPQGLALDVTGGADHLAIEADAGKRTSNGTIQGPALVEQVSATLGTETAGWSAAGLTGLTNASSEDASGLAAGISSDPDGSLNVLLATAEGARNSVIDDVKLPADLTGPTVLVSSEVDPSTAPLDGHDYPSAAQADDPDPTQVGSANGGLGKGGADGASAQVVELSNGLYASDFDHTNASFWSGAAGEGIRLIEPETGGLLTNPIAPVTSIFDTLGGATPGGTCNIYNEGVARATNQVVLAAGADGAVWALVQGGDSAAYEEAGGGETEAQYLTGRRVLELAPGASKTCAQPAKTFTLSKEGGGTPAPEGSSLTVAVGSTVDFNASTVEYPAASAGKQADVYAYEWDPTLGASGDPGYATIGDTVIPGALDPEPATASHTYTTPGEYTVGLKLLGDFGEYNETRTVIVQASPPPTASLTAPAEAQTGQTVNFSAVGSAPASGQTITDYHWNFGDGQSDDTQTDSDTHVYSSLGTHTVTLTVRDGNNVESLPVSQKITITSPPATKTETPTTTTTTPTTTTPASSPPPVAQIDRSATNVSPKALEKNGEVEVTVTCPATKVSCAGTVEVKTAAAVAARVAKKGKAKKSVLALGQATFSLTGGQRETLTLKLSAKGADLLKKSKRLKVAVLVAAHDSYGDPGSQTLGLTLTEPTKKAAKKK
jgi:PKD repeat protein